MQWFSMRRAYAQCGGGEGGAAFYLQDVALLDGGVLQLAGLLLQSLSRAAYWKAGQYLLWQPEGALALLHGHHLLLEALHFHQETLGCRKKKECRCEGNY